MIAEKYRAKVETLTGLDKILNFQSRFSVSVNYHIFTYLNNIKDKWHNMNNIVD